MTSRLRAAALVVAAFAASGCIVMKRDTSSSRRAFAQLTRDTALAELAKARPDAAAHLSSAAGWAAFGDGAGAAFDVEPGMGFGVAHDNASGAETFMTTAVTDSVPLRVVVVFADAARFNAFRVHGGTIELPPPPGVEVFCIEDGMLAPADDVAGALFRPDLALNSTK